MNSDIDLDDPRFTLHNPSQHPRYLTVPHTGGFSDIVALVEKKPGGELHRINNDGSVAPDRQGLSFDAYLAAGRPWVQQVSGLAVAALLHERTGAKS